MTSLTQTEKSEAGSAPALATSDRRNLLQSALGTIERLQARLDAVERAQREPIAIVGMACRAPGGVIDAESYWRILSEGRDVVGEIPPDRWDVDAYYDPDPSAPGKSRTKSGGFLDDIDRFDPGFFGISPREAIGLDPQQRLLLETAWEALENAAIPPDGLDGSQTGVFVGITSMDYSHRIDVADPARSDIYLATGTALNAAAGRISFTLGLQGPCMAIDTACSSSLVAIHTACQSLRVGECDLALAGGVNVILAPEPYVLISKWGMLSPDGRCKAFDDSANGFVRGEGCGLVTLERLSDAMANGRQILAVIRGSAINQDGRSSGLTAPNGLAQQAVVRRALRSANLKPAEVSYVEAHGTGTSLGDPIEIEALAAVYGEGRGSGSPLEIGSAKSNIGHLEAASGVMGMMKVVLAMQHQQLPASLHVKRPTTAINWETTPVRVSTSLHDWTAGPNRRLAGVSAFGFSGMNAHVILEEAPPPEVSANGKRRSVEILPMSARNPEALPLLAASYAKHLEANPEVDLADLCDTAAMGRSHHPSRMALLGADRADMLAKLRSVANGEGPQIQGQATAGGRTRIAFLFSGQGSQYAGMGRELYVTEPVFREVMDRCSAVVDPLIGRSLKDVVFSGGEGVLDQTCNTQPALYTLEVALASLWQSWGIEPSVVIGHSVGEFAAAAVAGLISVEDGARLIAERGRLMQSLPTGGSMVAVQGETHIVEREVAECSGRVSIAARNAPNSLVLAGAAKDVEAIAERLAAAGMRVQPLVVSHAFHSRLMTPIVEEFSRFAKGIPHQAPRISWLSTLTGGAFDWSQHDGQMHEYWSRHILEPVRFEQAIGALATNECQAIVEIGPHPVLIGLGKLCIGDKTTADWLPSLKRDSRELGQIIEGLGHLYVRGANVDWSNFRGTAPFRPIALPTYPFQRKHYLIGPLDPHRKSPGNVVHDLLGERLAIAGSSVVFERRVTRSDPNWVADHRIGSEVVMPMTAYLEAALAAIGEACGNAFSSVSGIEIHNPMILAEDEERTMQVVVDAVDAMTPRIHIFSRPSGRRESAWVLHATGSGASAADALPRETESFADIEQRCAQVIDTSSFYDGLRSMGVDFGPAFQGMRRMWTGAPGEARSEVEMTELVERDAGKYRLHPAVLDACLHVASSAMETLPGTDDGRIFLPVGVDRYSWNSSPQGLIRSYARVRNPDARGEAITLDVRIETPDGTAIAILDGLQCRRVSRDAFRQRMESRIADYFYETIWKESQLPKLPSEPTPGNWLILDDHTGRGSGLAAELERRGAAATLIAPSAVSTGAGAAAGRSAIRFDGLHQWLAGVGNSQVPAGIVNFWPLCIPHLTAATLPSEQAYGADALLLLLQALATASPETPMRLWVVTQGAMQVDGTETLRLQQSPVVGLAKVAAVEHPEFRTTVVDLDPQDVTGEARALANELLGDAQEVQVAFRKGARHVARLARKRIRPVQDPDANPQRLSIANRGTLENLAIEPFEPRAPGTGEVQIRVRASGLNFRDVLSALGMYPGEIRHLGSDCAGEVVALGEGVSGFAIGDRVVAMVEGAFASHANARWEFVAPLPAGLDYEQGAAIPTAYLTADITLNQIARMKRGDRVLIHSGAGGVGMAAIALALRAGAEIFATAGSVEKRAFLARLGVQHVMDSRSADFADEIHRITGGTGVNIVLNSLNGIMLDRSFEVLGQGGYFLEIGKRGLWTHEQAEKLGRDIQYHIVDCNDNARETPKIVGEIFSRVLRDIESGKLPTLPCTTFRFEEAPNAFRFMAQARHTGRVVFRHPAPRRRADPVIRDDSTYVVTGGLKGLGLLASQWLADEGARHLLLVGRSEPDAEASAAIETMVAGGVKVATVAADVSTADGVARLMGALTDRFPRIGGVVHCAAILDDGVLARQTPERFASVMAPKADGAWLIHKALLAGGHEPDFFVLYSSMSSTVGAAGQGNYVAANTFLDTLSRYRQSLGLPSITINWGAWKSVGMAARGTTVSRAVAEGAGALSPTEGMLALGLLLRDASAQVAVTPLNWQLLASRGESLPTSPVLQDLVAEELGRFTAGAGRAATRRGPVDLSGLPAVERLQRLTEMIRGELATVLALGSAGGTIADDDSFINLGLDSLTSVELRNRLQQLLGRAIPATAAFDWPTVEEMAAGLEGLYGEGGEEGVDREGEDREELVL